MTATQRVTEPTGGVGSGFDDGREDPRRQSDVELERRVHAGAAMWEELLDRLGAEGALPAPELAECLRVFLDQQYRQAMGAHVELLRRWVIDDPSLPHPLERGSRGRDGQ